MIALIKRLKPQKRKRETEHENQMKTWENMRLKECTKIESEAVQFARIESTSSCCIKQWEKIAVVMIIIGGVRIERLQEAEALVAALSRKWVTRSFTPSHQWQRLPQPHPAPSSFTPAEFRCVIITMLGGPK